MKGTREQRSQARMFQAYNRQRRYAEIHGLAALDAIDMIKSDQRPFVLRGHIDVKSWGLKRGDA